MATEAQLIQGLKMADAAGNTADAQHFADAIKALRAQPAGPQPSFMQDVAASPIGRLVHDAVVQPAEGLASLALKATPGFNMMSGAFNHAIKSAPEASYQNSLAAQRNVPGYAEARVKADAAQANLGAVAGNSLGQQFTAPFNSATAGLAGLLTGGWNRANAAADAQNTAQNTFSAAHPVASTAAQMIGGLAAVPERSAPMLLSPPKQPVPTIDDLNNAKNAAYSVVDNSPMKVSKSAVQDMVDNLQSTLDRRGWNEKLLPKTASAMDSLREAAQSDQTLQGLDVQRRIAGIAAGAPDKADRAAARLVQDHIDNFISNIQPEQLSGPVDQAAIDALPVARDAANRSFKAQAIQSLIDKAGISGSSYGASGYENALRQQFMKLAKNDRGMARFTPAEQALIKRVATGGSPASVNNLLRQVGKLSPQGVIPMLSEMGAVAVGGPHMLAVPAAGFAAKAGATAMTKAAAQRALEAVLLGKTAIPQVSAPLLGGARIPQTLPYGLIGSTAPQFAQ